MVVIMSTTGPLTLRTCRSVEMVSGMKPCSMAGAALRNQKLLAPWPRSKITPRLRAANRHDDSRSHDQSNSLAFAPNGRLLASANRGGRVRLWDVAGRKESGQLAPVAAKGSTERVK
jgi:WD40 repeat protein